MSRASKEPIRTFTVGFEQKEYDERDRAQLVVDKIHSVHREKVLDPQEILRMLDDIILYYEEPFGDDSSISSFYVARFASEDVKLVLTGDCADELFGGYEKYLGKYYASRYMKMPKLLRSIFETLVKAVPQNRYTNVLLRKINKVIRYAGQDDFSLYYNLMCRGFNDEQRRLLMKEGHYEDIKPLVKAKYDEAAGLSYLQQEQYTDVSILLEGCMFPKMNRACQYSGVKNRAPFMDDSIVKLALNMPDEFKIDGRNKKRILKDTFADILPEKTVGFGKIGFSVPIDYWLRNDLREQLEQLLSQERLEQQGLFDYNYVKQIVEEHMSGAANHKGLLWNLYVFQKWYDRHR